MDLQVVKSFCYFIYRQETAYVMPISDWISDVCSSVLHLDVFRNIAFPLHAQKMARGAIQEKGDWAAKMFGISALLQRKPRQLSGGERQRVALARAVVRERSEERRVGIVCVSKLRSTWAHDLHRTQTNTIN